MRRTTHLRAMNYETMTSLMAQIPKLEVFDKKLDTNVDLITSEMYPYLFNKHINKRFIKYLEQQTDTARLIELWNGFILTRKIVIEDFYNALALDYNPLDNYDKYSEIRTDDDLTHGAHTDETNYHSAQKKTTGQTDSHPYGYNSSNYSNDNKTNSSATADAYIDKTEEKKATYTDERDVVVSEHTHGNIGVVDSVTLIKNELDLRKFNLAQWVVDEFAKENLFYC